MAAFEDLESHPPTLSSPIDTKTIVREQCAIERKKAGERWNKLERTI